MNLALKVGIYLKKKINNLSIERLVMDILEKWMKWNLFIED
jgi:uncharacterized membrane protein YczE